MRLMSIKLETEIVNGRGRRERESKEIQRKREGENGGTGLGGHRDKEKWGREVYESVEERGWGLRGWGLGSWAPLLPSPIVLLPGHLCALGSSPAQVRCEAGE